MSRDIKPLEQEEIYQLKLRLEGLIESVNELLLREWSEKFRNNEEFIKGTDKFDTDEDTQSPEYLYACNVSDALSWVLGEITTDRFCSDAYLDIEALEKRVEDLRHRIPESGQ